MTLERARETAVPAGASARGISAIVVTYRSARELPRCLEPLLSAGAEVWVVDNASDDGTVDFVRVHFPDVRLIANRSNEGFAAANNRALRHVCGDVVLLVNPDCELDPDSARMLAQFLRSHPGAGAVGPRIEDAREKLMPSAHRFETPGSVLFMLVGGRSFLPIGAKRALAGLTPKGASYAANFETREPREVDWVSGACMAVRTEALRQVGGFDEGYFLFMEDEHLCRSLWERGWKVVYLPAARARHSGGASSGDRVHVWPEFYRSLLRFHRLTQPRTYPLVRAVVALRAVAGIALGTARDAFYLARSRPRQHRAAAWRRILALALRAKGGVGR